MGKRFTLLLILCFFSLISTGGLYAQSVAENSLQKNAMNNAVSLYHTSLGEQSQLYKGPEYYFYNPTFKGNAYFLDVNAFTTGSVFYDGVLYTGVPMLYDLYAEKIAVLLFDHYNKYSLLNERVKYFKFLDHNFINISADSLGSNTDIKPGFYDVLYQGKLQVLAKRAKDIQTTGGATTVPESYFNLTTRLFLKKGNHYLSITGKRSMLDALKDRKKEIQQYIRSKRLKFRKEPEAAMVEIATYYDHLTN